MEQRLGPLTWANLDATALDQALENLRRRGNSIYSAAYIMPSPSYGRTRKHSNHIALLLQMMKDRLPERIKQAPSLRTVYELVLSYPGIGPFLAFQYTIDLNYSSVLDFDEADLVVAGPGALDGISKCFSNTGRATPEDVIYWMTDRQENELARLGLRFGGLYGRPLQPIDCQNVFCEISKYARVAHPDIAGIANRTRIKQIYRPNHRPLPVPQFPSRWGLHVPFEQAEPRKAPYREPVQPSFI
ncbi:MAG: nucleotide kinase domain-containing protein [Bradyrhizobium sp.]